MPESRASVVDLGEFIVNRHVKNFMLAYRSKGKVAAGLLLPEIPELYKKEVVSRLTEILKLK